jgi:hypothetical protein
MYDTNFMIRTRILCVWGRALALALKHSAIMDINTPDGTESNRVPGVGN